MFKEWITVAMIGGALLVLPVVSSQAAPAIKPELSTPAGSTHAIREGRGGGGLFKGGGGARFGGLNRGGPRVGAFNRGGSTFSRGRGVPRLSGRGYSGFKGYSGRHHRRHRRSRGFAFYGIPYVYAYAYDDYSCGWLRRRALRTGSSYWWRRYEACRYGYDY